MIDIAAYVSLFTTAFLAATLVPLQSEAVLIGLLAGGYSPVALLIVAGADNVLGASVNWLLGRFIERFRHRRWFPVGDAALDRAQKFYGRYGRWSLLLSWVPVIGDPLTLAAGLMRESFLVFLLLVTVAKVGRYGFIVLGFLGLA